MKISCTHQEYNIKSTAFFVALIFLSACTSAKLVENTIDFANDPLVLATATLVNAPTPFATRPIYQAGELVEYEAQTGDTLPAVAAHFNTSVEEIMAANPTIPKDVTTLPPGFPMQIPIYYRPFWGSPYQIIPDSHFVNGPVAIGFNTAAFVEQQSGWLKNYSAYAAEETRTGAEIIDFVAAGFSISPRVLLTILEMQTSALSSQIIAPETRVYPLGFEVEASRGLYLQLVWAANILNNAYYGWRIGSLTTFERPDGRIEQPDPWQNAASVSLQVYFNQALPSSGYENAIGPDGFAKLYTTLFGDAWEEETHIPGSLRQPELRLPFEPGKLWTLTGGPHVGWGEREGTPLSAFDFAPPSEEGGCVTSEEWATAVADGIVVRTGRGSLFLDLDGDGEERSGWVIFYLHIETRDKALVGDVLKAGDYIGHPSCEGGISTGSHQHIARKFNGEWMPAAGVLPFVMEDWIPFYGSRAYLGGMTRYGVTITACECSSVNNQLSTTISGNDTP